MTLLFVTFYYKNLSIVSLSAVENLSNLGVTVFQLRSI